MTTLIALRARKTAVVDRMDALNIRAKKEDRYLTEVEQVQFDTWKGEAENLVACILELEKETNFGVLVAPSAPQPEPELPEALGLNRHGDAAVAARNEEIYRKSQGY